MELVRPRNYPVFEVERTVGCKSSTTVVLMRTLNNEFRFKEKTGCTLCGRVSLECLIDGARCLVTVSKSAIVKALTLQSVKRGANVTLQAFEALRDKVADEFDGHLEGETKELSKALATRVLEGGDLLDQHLRLRREASRLDMHTHIRHLHTIRSPIRMYDARTKIKAELKEKILESYPNLPDPTLLCSRLVNLFFDRTDFSGVTFHPVLDVRDRKRRFMIDKPFAPYSIFWEECPSGERRYFVRLKTKTPEGWRKVGAEKRVTPLIAINDATRQVTRSVEVLSRTDEPVESLYIRCIARSARLKDTPAVLIPPRPLCIYTNSKGERMLLSVQDEFERGSLIDALQTLPERLPIEKVGGLLKPLANGLACLHANGLVHTDVKGDNIFVDAEWNPVWGDTEDYGLTRTTLLNKATPRYLSPESSTLSPEERKANPADDVWAFGCVISLLMQAGWPPFLERADTIEKTAAIDPRRILPTSYLREPVEGCLPLIMRSCFLPEHMRPEMGEVFKMLCKNLTQPLPSNWTKVDYKEFFHLD